MTYLQRIERLLDMPPARKAEVLRELESHLADTCAELIASGLDPSQAQQEAEARMGPADDVASRLTAAHNTASWRSALLAAAPFLASSLALLLTRTRWHWLPIGAVALIGLVSAAGSLREFVRGRRPVWLAAWLAAAVTCAQDVRLRGLVADHIVRQSRHLHVTRWLSDVRADLTDFLLTFVSLSILALFVALAARRARPTMLIACAAFTGCALTILVRNPSGVFVPAAMAITMLVAWFVILVVFARIVFESHPYGNPVHASLFLLAYILLEFPTTATKSHPYEPLAFLLVGAAVIWIARAPTRLSKTKALTVAIIPPSLAGMLIQISLGASHPIILSIAGAAVSLALSLAVNLAVVRSFIFIPIWYGYRRSASPNPPAIAS